VEEVRGVSEGRAMVTVDLEPDIEERVLHFALENQVSESLMIRGAVLRWLEDRGDYAAGIKTLSNLKYFVSQEEMERRADVVG
jgi:hypothetical protein